MKKIISLVLAGVMMLSLAACGGNTNETTAPAETTLPAVETTEVPAETNAPAASADGALGVLENIWNLYGEDEKFAVIGGNMESPVDGAPGNYDMAYAENLNYNLIVPADQIASIDEAATMVHMMNANTFTAGVVHLTEGTDAAAFAEIMKDALNGNMWMCGFPEMMHIAVVDGSYVVIAFGAGDLVSIFANHLTGAYAEAEVLFDQPIEC